MRFFAAIRKNVRRRPGISYLDIAWKDWKNIILPAFGGQQQRVALARMMIGEPEAILLDEPFSALDGYLKDVMQRDMQDFLNEYKGDMIMVTHSRDEAYKFCEQLMLLKDGRTIIFGDTKGLFKQPVLLEAARLTGCKKLFRNRDY